MTHRRRIHKRHTCKLGTTILLSQCALLSSADVVFAIDVRNPAPFPRESAVAEFPAEEVTKAFGKEFVVRDSLGNIVTHQLTGDNKILIGTDLEAGKTASFIITHGIPVTADTICLGMIRHDMQDDYTWENDRGGYRLYGPSYRNGGGNVAGYDIWTKSVDFPVLKQRYDDHCQHGISYHKDQGNGMDCYTVGKTLGAGMNALVTSGAIAYPCAYESCEILESGPLRTSAKITCVPETIDGKTVVEERVITLDKGSWLNKTDVAYKGLASETPLVTGIVIHKQNTSGCIADPQKRFIAYADLTDNPDNGNGVIYIGIVNRDLPDECAIENFDAPVGDAVGHILNKTAISPGQTYTYYWGSGWSKGGVKGMEDWTKILSRFALSLEYPLEVTVRQLNH